MNLLGVRGSTPIVVTLIGLLLVLLGVSTYQILNLQKQVNELKTSPQPTPSPVSVETTVPAESSGMVSPAPTGGTNEPLELVGTIAQSEVEGNCWIIRADSPQCVGDKCSLGLAAPYVPVNLPNELKRIGIKAKFKLEVLFNVATTCQVGPAVKILGWATE